MNAFIRSKAFIAIFATMSLVRLILMGFEINYHYGRILPLFAIEVLIIVALYLIFTILFFLMLKNTNDFQKYKRALEILLIFGVAILSFGSISDFIDRRNSGIQLNPLEILWVPFSVFVPIFQSTPFAPFANILTTIIQIVLISAILLLRRNGEGYEKGSTNVIPSASMWTVRIPGQPETPVDTATIQNWVKTGFVSRNTMITEVSTGYSYQAHQIPGLFSSKSYVTSLLLSFFFGVFGVDRFYLGHVGVGLGKLFTLGGLGIWALIDFILIATKNVKDSQGLPLV